MRIDQAKRAVAECVKKGGGYDAAAEWMGCAKATLHNLQNQNMPDDPRDRPLAWLMRLDEFAGTPIMLQAIASAKGFTLAVIEGDGTQDFRDAIIRLSGDVGQLTHDCALAIADSVVDQSEEKSIRKNLSQARSTIIQFEEALDQACKQRGRSA